MPSLPSVFDCCKPRREVLQGELPDAIFAADLWDVFTGSANAHADYRDPARFFAGTHPTENMKLLVKDVAQRLAGVEGCTPVIRLETGFGGGKTHSLIALVHVGREGQNLAPLIPDYGVTRFPAPGETRIAAFVGDVADPLVGIECVWKGYKQRVYTPWGQIAFLAAGPAGYDAIKENDQAGVAPSRPALRAALGDGPVLILLDELVLYMARAVALPETSPRQKVNSQWPTFLQTLFGLAAARPRTALVFTLPSEQDANRKLVGELKQHLYTVLETPDELASTAARQALNLTPTQSFERASVLSRRLFDSVDRASAGAVAEAYTHYYEQQRDAKVQIDGRAFAGGEKSYAALIEKDYPFHPEFVRLFAERLAEIPDFHQTRGALRLAARTIRAVWDRRQQFQGALLLHAQHVDLTRSEIRDEILNRLKRSAFERGLDADVVKAEGGTHASEAETGWPWKAATESASVAFLHSLPDGSKGVTAAEVALAVGRPGVDLNYVAQGLEETERRAWYMRREADHYLFRTRASVNKRYQERLGRVQPGEVRETLDAWVKDVYSGFTALQVISFPADHTAIPDNADKVRLVLVHYDKEGGFVGPGAGERLNFVKQLYTKTGVNESPRTYRNNLVFLLAENSRVAGLKDAVKSLIAWERVQKDIEVEQSNLAQAGGSTFADMRRRARDNASGVPAEFMALEEDLSRVRELLGPQEVNVRTKLLEAYRVLAFPSGGGGDHMDLFSGVPAGPLLECYRVDFGEKPEPAGRGRRSERRAVAEAPILQCLRQNSKLAPEATAEGDPVVLAPELLNQLPLLQVGETCLSTQEVWERLRKEPEAPMVLRQTDLRPTFRAGVTATPTALWVYYVRPDKKVYTRENAAELVPAISANHLLYGTAAAIADRIMPVREVASQELWDHLWPKSGTAPAETVAAPKFLEAARASAHFPVLPDRAVLWKALQEGARENRWVLYLRGPNLAVGAQEMNEWPGTPRFEDAAEFWTYQAALDQGIYPHKADPGGPFKADPLTPARLKEKCWPAGAARRSHRRTWNASPASIWADLSRPRLETVLREGVRHGVWCAWRKDSDETFYTRLDSPAPAVQVGPAWALVDPAAPLAQELDGLRPGKGPQPVTQAGTPREVLTGLWDALAGQRNVRVAELALAVEDRETFDNTLLATWADRPKAAQVHASVMANGQRVSGGKTETIKLEYEGRFEEIRSLMAPVWPFGKQGELQVTITVSLKFPSPPELNDADLETYRTAVINANQGRLEGRRWFPCRCRAAATRPASEVHDGAVPHPRATASQARADHGSCTCSPTCPAGSRRRPTPGSWAPRRRRKRSSGCGRRPSPTCGRPRNRGRRWVPTSDPARRPAGCATATGCAWPWPSPRPAT